MARSSYKHIPGFMFFVGTGYVANIVWNKHTLLVACWN